MHLLLLVFVLAFAVGVAAINQVIQLRRRYQPGFLTATAWQLALFNAILALNLAYWYLRVNFEPTAASVETGYHALSIVLKVAWAWLFWVMVQQLTARTPQLVGIRQVAAAVILAVWVLAGVWTDLVRLATAHLFIEVMVIAAALASSAFLALRAGGLAEPRLRRIAATLGRSLFAIWLIATVIFVAGSLLLPAAFALRLVISAILLLVYNLVPLLSLDRLLRSNDPSASSMQPPTDAALEHFAEERGISPRELEVIQCICEGKRNLEIADTLCISLQTVKDHASRIYRKLGVRNRVELVNTVQKAAQNEPPQV